MVNYLIFFLFFSVSNEVPDHPVVSPVSGCVYERRLIEKYIAENASDPMNGEKLTVEMLIDVKSKYICKTSGSQIASGRKSYITLPM